MKRLVLIDCIENRYDLYVGKEVVRTNTFGRPLFPDEVELFRTDANRLLSGQLSSVSRQQEP